MRSTRQAVEGQIEGGIAQGLGLALMEEIQTRDGLITNASFTDYLIPTALDMPPVETVIIEDPEPDAPYGVKGVGEPPTVVSTAAVVAALRDATRPRAPTRPGLARRDRRSLASPLRTARPPRSLRRGRRLLPDDDAPPTRRRSRPRRGSATSACSLRKRTPSRIATTGLT